MNLSLMPFPLLLVFYHVSRQSLWVVHLEWGLLAYQAIERGVGRNYCRVYSW